MIQRRCLDEPQKSPASPSHHPLFSPPIHVCPDIWLEEPPPPPPHQRKWGVSFLGNHSLSPFFHSWGYFGGWH